MVIKVVDVNAWWSGTLFQPLVDFLTAQAADVITLQEVYNESDPGLEDRYRLPMYLQAELGYQYLDFVPMFIHDGPAGKLPFGLAVLSKFPITARSARFFVAADREYYLDIPEEWPVMPRALQQVRLDTPAGLVNVFNVHGVWDTDGDSYSPARQTMSRVMLAAVEGQTNVILTGDTNAKASNQALLNLEPTLTSVFGQSLTTTFNMRRKDDPGYASAAVDLMFVSPNIKVVSRACPDVDISDHRPIVVELAIE